jgi:hypothetical protein
LKVDPSLSSQDYLEGELPENLHAEDCGFFDVTTHGFATRLERIFQPRRPANVDTAEADIHLVADGSTVSESPFPRELAVGKSLEVTARIQRSLDRRSQIISEAKGLAFPGRSGLRWSRP